MRYFYAELSDHPKKAGSGPMQNIVMKQGSESIG
jgi:hypothetical protein